MTNKELEKSSQKQPRSCTSKESKQADRESDFNINWHLILKKSFKVTHFIVFRKPTKYSRYFICCRIVTCLISKRSEDVAIEIKLQEYAVFDYHTVFWSPLATEPPRPKISVGLWILHRLKVGLKSLSYKNCYIFAADNTSLSSFVNSELHKRKICIAAYYAMTVRWFCYQSKKGFT